MVMEIRMFMVMVTMGASDRMVMFMVIAIAMMGDYDGMMVVVLMVMVMYAVQHVVDKVGVCVHSVY